MCKSVSSSSVHGTDMSLHRRLDEQTVLVTAVIVVVNTFILKFFLIERNQKPLAPEITLAVTHHNRQKQVEVKRSSRVNPHEIRIFSGCPYAVVK